MQTDGTVNLRKATVKDCAGLARVQVDSYRTAYAGIFSPTYLAHFTYEEQEQDWRDLLASETEDVLYVAETDTGEIVGYALGRAGASEVGPYDSELVALHVRRSHQRQGVGRQLVRVIAERLKQRGCASMMLWVLEENASRAFYEQMGGQLLNERKITQGAAEVAYGWLAIESLCE
jgi:ribosomal protein S18 acetylase RimI-like enzyme